MTYEQQNEEELRNTQNLSDEEYVHLLWHAANSGRDWKLLMGDRESPLSGEWAGESIPEISERYDIDLFDTELQNAFERGFHE